jgi:hypothetical protein
VLPKGFCFSALPDKHGCMPSMKAHDFSGYRQFTANLRRLAGEPSWSEERSREVTASLDGVAGKELQKLVSLPARRAFGAFFTGSELAEKLLGTLRLRSDKYFIYDPTVGAGDLLLAGARRLPLERLDREFLRKLRELRILKHEWRKRVVAIRQRIEAGEIPDPEELVRTLEAVESLLS